jgi:hypothetical protein
MIPSNEAAKIVVACKHLDAILRKKYMVIGGTFVACALLYMTAFVLLYKHEENYFLVFFVLPLILHLLIEMYIDRLNIQLKALTRIIKCNHENNVMKYMQRVSANRSNEV